MNWPRFYDFINTQSHQKLVFINMQIFGVVGKLNRNWKWNQLNKFVRKNSINFLNTILLNYFKYDRISELVEIKKFFTTQIKKNSFRHQFSSFIVFNKTLFVLINILENRRDIYFLLIIIDKIIIHKFMVKQTSLFLDNQNLILSRLKNN